MVRRERGRRRGGARRGAVAIEGPPAIGADVHAAVDALVPAAPARGAELVHGVVDLHPSAARSVIATEIAEGAVVAPALVKRNSPLPVATQISSVIPNTARGIPPPVLFTTLKLAPPSLLR